MTILVVPGFMLDGEFDSIVDVDTTRDASIEDMAARAIASVDGPLYRSGSQWADMWRAKSLGERPTVFGVLS
jgi:hypothetical protein